MRPEPLTERIPKALMLGDMTARQLSTVLTADYKCVIRAIREIDSKKIVRVAGYRRGIGRCASAAKYSVN